MQIALSSSPGPKLERWIRSMACSNISILIDSTLLTSFVNKRSPAVQWFVSRFKSSQGRRYFTTKTQTTVLPRNIYSIHTITIASLIGLALTRKNSLQVLLEPSSIDHNCQMRKTHVPETCGHEVVCWIGRMLLWSDSNQGNSIGCDTNLGPTIRRVVKPNR